MGAIRKARNDAKTWAGPRAGRGKIQMVKERAQTEIATPGLRWKTPVKETEIKKKGVAR